MRLNLSSRSVYGGWVESDLMKWPVVDADVCTDVNRAISGRFVFQPKHVRTNVQYYCRGRVMYTREYSGRRK